jgi:hypothetical protein
MPPSNRCDLWGNNGFYTFHWNLVKSEKFPSIAMNTKLVSALLSTVLLTLISRQAIANEAVSIPLPAQASTTCGGAIEGVKVELAKKGYFSNRLPLDKQG